MAASEQGCSTSNSKRFALCAIFLKIRSMAFSCSNKATRLDKAKIGEIDFTLLGATLIFVFLILRPNLFPGSLGCAVHL